MQSDRNTLILKVVITKFLRRHYRIMGSERNMKFMLAIYLFKKTKMSAVDSFDINIQPLVHVRNCVLGSTVHYRFQDMCFEFQYARTV